MENENVLSLDELLARSERVDQGLIQRRRQRDEQVVTARDDWALVEVGVNGHGDVVEVAINAALVRQVEPLDLAEAVLQAASAAQRQARGNWRNT
jgi:DNA-binding protein YbaB